MKEFPVVMGEPLVYGCGTDLVAVTDGPSKFFRPTGYAYDPARRGNI
jgi:hypothetical protein